jgi:iron(III) transport system ATP-binding protein
MSAITLQGLTKRFGPVTAVDGVSLEITSGELFFLLGPSGCGKTTLLRMIAGFTPPTAGRIAFGDRDVTHDPPNRRNTGMVFQSYALWPHMTVLENVAFGLRVRRVRGAARREQAMAALRSVRMEEEAERRPGELSGGQQQRVALARALVVRPTVLLLDEPLSNLDARLRIEMRSEIRRICGETGITTVYVTHDQGEALSMADRLAVLSAGRVVQAGTPREVYRQPSSRFVAAFVGDTNLVPAQVVERDDDGTLLETPGGRVRSRSRVDGERVTCSLRPEALRITANGRGGLGLRGVRAAGTYLGDLGQHAIELPDGSILRVLQLNPPPFGSPGEPVTLEIDPEDVVVVED